MLVDNEISEARDLLAGERNYLTILRTTFTVIVASSAVLMQSTLKRTTTTLDWVVSGMLALVALVLPISALVNYNSQTREYLNKRNLFRNSHLLIALLLTMSLLGIIVSVDALTHLHD
ncbi:hypothetical protein DASB73_026300 [Starmerella bacillaris]|uniref:DUF202 domain-containing protein n=1 Tax=Starmerella bacillaris TaxID=1247836 RepID=A0AAV5RL05_STABA|nr:hypothetical protein DASB73_026300 [Starmerella bacillaris]